MKMVSRFQHPCGTFLTSVSLTKGDERYVLMFDAANRAEALRMLGRWAGDPQLSLTWYDCAILSKEIRNAVH